MSDIASRKAAARTHAFAARAEAHAEGLDGRACAALQDFLAEQPAAEIIAGYMAIRTEVNPLSVMTALHRAGKTLCVPVVMGAGRALAFSRWTPEGPLVKGAFGAMVPAHEDFLQPDLLIAPLVAFDNNGHRLGYGGGFYDRSLVHLRAQKPVRMIGFAYSAQALPALPTEPTDQPLDAVVTENGALWF